MVESTNILAVTLVLMTAGSAIYTIKTYIHPGMKIAINLAEINDQSLDETEEPMIQTTHYSLITTLGSTQPKTESTTTSLPITVRKVRPTKHEIIEMIEITDDLDDSQREIEGEPIRKRSVVETKSGFIEGIEQEVSGRTVLAFLGIHYAMAPIDELRFRKPKPIEPWVGVRSAKQYGSPCIQYLPNITDLPMTPMKEDFSEDCLHLNVWTNSLTKPLKPVIIFIHGGSFAFGSNSIDETDGRVLASMENVIVVTINYRLGPFGFINAKTNETAGNMGLHDMLTAIKWIKTNVRVFGGDPNAITLVGHSSGAIAASIFMTSPMAKNLFKRVILQSGSATVFNNYFQRSFQSTEKLAEMLGCADSERNLTTHPEPVIKCMREMPVQRLKRATEDQLMEELYSYSPTIDNEVMPYLPKDSIEGHRILGHQKEILIGTNSDEGALFFHMGNPDVFSKYWAPDIKSKEEAKQLLSSSLRDWGLSKPMFKLMNSFFMDKIESIESKVILKAMHDVFGDMVFTCPAVYLSEKLAKMNKTVYYYYYSHRSDSFNRSDWFGSTHFDELPFVFGHPLRYPNRYSGNDIDFSKKMMNIWAQFARNGKPPAINGKNWPKYSTERPEYVELNGKLNKSVIGKGPHSENCETWKYAFKLFN